MNYDIIIIGGGPAGLTAGIYARRAGKKVLVIEKNTFGGQITYSPSVENIPGFTALSGNEFAEKLVDQALYQDVEFTSSEVTMVEKKEDRFLVHTEDKTEESRAVIIASGARHRRLHLPNEEQYIGNGISFCAVCDGAFYKNGVVGVVGGGNSALQEAVLLSTIASKVYIFQDLPYLTGEKKLADKLKEADNVEILTGVRVTQYIGADSLTGIVYENKETNEEQKLELDGLFLAVGLIPQNEPVRELADIDERGYIIASEDCKTKTKGLYAAGDCRTKRVRQVSTAAADGAVSALAACDYIEGRD